MTETQAEGPAKTVEVRKRPQQERSRDLVERILETAQRLMKEEGVKGLATVRIAKRAGLSVGSLYQYFPNKEAIILELARRWLAANRAVFDARAPEPPASWAAFRTQLRDLTFGFLNVYRQYFDLLPILELMSANPDLRRIDEAHNALMIGQLADWFGRINPALDPGVARRFGRLLYELGHVALVMAADPRDPAGEALLGDFHTMLEALVRPHLAIG